MESPGSNNPPASEADKLRDRSRRGERGTRFSDNKDNEMRDRSREKQAGNGKRVYVSNIPYEYRWQDLKDLFRRQVGNVEYVELFVDENGKPRGCGIVEFKDPENVGKALDVMNRYELNGREIVVKEDHGEERDKYGRIARGGAGGGGGGGGGGANLDSSRNMGSGMGGKRNHGRDRDDDRYLLVLKLFHLYFFKENPFELNFFTRHCVVTSNECENIFKIAFSVLNKNLLLIINLIERSKTFI